MKQSIFIIIYFLLNVTCNSSQYELKSNDEKLKINWTTQNSDGKLELFKSNKNEEKIGYLEYSYIDKEKFKEYLINFLYIYLPFRKKGYSEILLKFFIQKIIEENNKNEIILYPMGLEDEKTNKLFEFYKKLGFEKSDLGMIYKQ